MCPDARTGAEQLLTSVAALLARLESSQRLVAVRADDVPVLPGLDEDPEEVKVAAAKEAALKRKAEGGREVPEDR